MNAWRRRILSVLALTSVVGLAGASTAGAMTAQDGAERYLGQTCKTVAVTGLPYTWSVCDTQWSVAGASYRYHYVTSTPRSFVELEWELRVSTNNGMATAKAQRGDAARAGMYASNTSVASVRLALTNSYMNGVGTVPLTFSPL